MAVVVTLSHPLVRSHDSNTWSARSLAQVKNWIASYQQYHGSQAHQCPPSTGTVRPTRLLDVGTDDEAQVVYLRDTGSLPDHGSNIVYIVLSHCWGGTLSKKLVHESLNDFRQGIRLADLPKTFRDAIQVTRKLGVNYLWIDGLCIIQDSRSDWLAESSVMGEIYANSYVNLAAAASADSHEGLFQSRNPVTVVPCHVSASGPHQPPGEYICYSPGQFSHYVDHGPLNARAWTKQERALAPRTLHFARDQLYWQCSSIIASQCFPRGSPTGLAKYNIRAWKGILTEVTDPVELDYSWFWIVLDYCRGNLTYPGDKLVALSGFAKQWGQLRGFPSSSYLAGLWLDQLPHSLCWYTEHRGCSTRPAQYRAPTWSWASVDGHIIPSAQRPKHVWKRIKLAEIVAAQTTPSNTGLGEYGPVERGYLRIQSHMCAMETVVGIQELRDNGEAWILSLGESGEEKVRVRWDEKSKDLKPCIPDPELYLLVVLRYFAIKTEDYSYPDCLDCLVLQPCHGARGQYRRVGLLDAVGSDVTKKLIRQSGLTILEEQLYDQVDEEKRYTIEIV